MHITLKSICGLPMRTQFSDTEDLMAWIKALHLICTTIEELALDAEQAAPVIIASLQSPVTEKTIDDTGVFEQDEPALEFVYDGFSNAIKYDELFEYMLGLKNLYPQVDFYCPETPDHS